MLISNLPHCMVTVALSNALECWPVRWRMCSVFKYEVMYTGGAAVATILSCSLLLDLVGGNIE